MTATAANAELVEQGDLDELVRQVERLCAAREWDGLVDLHDRCRRALERGKQLWPAASLAEYRLALHAPGPWAGAVVSTGTAQFSLGPLAEVAASTHTWAELATTIGSGPGAALAAHERVLRGEDLRGDRRVPSGVLDLPLVLQDWEPAYALAEYGADKAAFPTPPLPSMTEVILLAEAPEEIGDPEACAALSEVAGVWATQSNGRSSAVCVEGDAPAALRALGLRRARLAAVELDEALAHLAWAGASGGAHGRRRGAASGRFAAWWALAALAGATEDWPVAPEALGEVASAMRWYLWDASEPATGWALRVAVEAPDEGLAWAVVATDEA